jgi:sporulation protein YlmC with PRC-barrel domain
MNMLESRLTGQPVISLQTGQQVARLHEPLVTVGKLELIAFTCRTSRSEPTLLLMAGDVRQYAPDCIIVDDEDTLTDPADIVRLTADLKDRYSPLGKPVFADSGRKLGNVEDYELNLEKNCVQKIHVGQPFWASWFNPPLQIDRSQILDVTPSRITVRDATEMNPVMSPDSIPEAQP